VQRVYLCMVEGDTVIPYGSRCPVAQRHVDEELYCLTFNFVVEYCTDHEVANLNLTHSYCVPTSTQHHPTGIVIISKKLGSKRAHHVMHWLLSMILQLRLVSS